MKGFIQTGNGEKKNCNENERAVIIGTNATALNGAKLGSATQRRPLFQQQLSLRSFFLPPNHYNHKLPCVTQVERETAFLIITYLKATFRFVLRFGLYDEN